MRLIKANVRGSTRVVHGKMQIVHSYERKDAPKRFVLKIEDKGFREKEFRSIEEAVSEIEKYELPGVLISIKHGEKTIRLPFEEWKHIHADEYGLFGSRPDFDELLGKYKDREIKHRSGLSGGGRPMVQLSLFRSMAGRPAVVKATIRKATGMAVAPEALAPGKIRNRPGLHFDRMKHRWLKNDQQGSAPRVRTGKQESAKASGTRADSKAVTPEAPKEEIKQLAAWLQEHGGKIPKTTDAKIGLGGGKVIPAGASEIQLPKAKADKDKWNVKWRHPVTGKWEYHYKQEFLEGNAKKKFAKMADMARTVVKIRHRIETDLNPENPTDIRSVLAIQTWMLDHLYARIGSEENTKEHGVKGVVTYGLTTLTKDHVMFTSKGVQIKYIGKKSQIQKHMITDPKVVEAMRGLYHATPNERLFQYKDQDGWHPASADKLNDHLKTNYGLTGKDFRTFHATHLCWTHLRSVKLPKSERERTKALNSIIKSKVAPLLGHTFSACKNNYIDPGLQEAYLRGKIPEKLWGVLEKSFTRILKGFLS